jgi:hypothetical protein
MALYLENKTLNAGNERYINYSLFSTLFNS